MISPNAHAMPALGVPAKEDAPNVTEAITNELMNAAGTKYIGAEGHIGPFAPASSRDSSQGKKMNGSWKQKGIPMATIALEAK
jgi:hypothetical protein